MVKDIKCENRPWWYELTWDATTSAILIAVHNDFIRESKSFARDNHLVLYFERELDLNGLFDSFNGDLKNGHFGFSEAFRRIQERENCVFFSIDIPQIKQYTGQICCECGGRRENEHGMLCFSCYGEGKEFVYNWRQAYAISVSLTLFLKIASIYEGETNTEHPQLLTIETSTSKGAHGGSLCGEISDYLSRQMADCFVNGNSDSAKQEIIKTMKIAYRQLFASTDGIGYYDARLTEGGRFSVGCPGNACGLYSDGYEYNHNGRIWGHRFSCHNVDNPGQQLTLLAGLAALLDYVIKNS